MKEDTILENSTQMNEETILESNTAESSNDFAESENYADGQSAEAYQQPERKTPLGQRWLWAEEQPYCLVEQAHCGLQVR